MEPAVTVPGRSWRFSAPAKVNLSLRVVGRRPDGYHLLQTVMTFFPLFDILEITPTDGPLSLTCDPPVTGIIEENLVHRAAVALRRETGTGRGAHIHLQKHIPHGAGLGGGSSDAASTLLALNALWELRLPLEKLIDIGVALGADVPIFLGGRAALAQGAGERLTPLPTLPEVELLLVNPGVVLSTGSVFKALAGQFNLSRPLMALPGTVDWHMSDLLENDLQPAACRLAPIIDEIVAALKTSGATAVLMSGSGSSVFGLFPNAHHSQRALNGLKTSHPQWQIHQGRTFNIHPFTEEWAVGV